MPAPDRQPARATRHPGTGEDRRADRGEAARRRTRASTEEARRQRALQAGRLGRPASPPPRARLGDLYDLPPSVVVWLAGGGLLGALVVMAIGARLAGDPIIGLLAPVSGGDEARGFAVGFCSGIPPAIVTYWLLFLRRRADPLHGVKTLLGCLLFVVIAIPWLVMMPPSRPRTRGISAQQRAVMRSLPGSQTGALTVFLGAGVLFGAVYLFSSARGRR